MKIIKWLTRKKIAPVYTLPGDSVTLTFHGKEVAHHPIVKTMKIDEVGIFEGKVDGRDALGGVFIGEKQHGKTTN